ncbi:ATP-NAD kinase-like domain-containing protein [Dichotomocladium elegans]|nr:ATP-NAD kinase-like domain-containing protein [Dichotomocladium elegans]
MKVAPAFSSERLSDTAGVVREVAKKIGRARIRWDNVSSIMIITKPGDLSLVSMTRKVALWLLQFEQLVGLTKMKERYPNIKLNFWNPELCTSNPKGFDLIITLGGDGTVLFTSWLFQSYVPPVVPFSLGSLGFLTPFDFENYKKHLTTIINKGVRINLRGRLTCTVYRRIPQLESDKLARPPQLRNVRRNPVTGKIVLGDIPEDGRKKFGEVDGEDMMEYDRETVSAMMEERRIPCFTTVPVERYHVINDLVVDRGPSPFVSMLELFGDDQHLTTVQADGLAISTPTGSTAYSLSAGGSLTHPEIHALLITPICPHTLSFRPTLVPDSMELRVCVPYNSRNTAWASFDGRGRIEIKQGEHIKITASRHPFPTVCRADQTTDWFNALQNCLHWNIRQRQKAFAVVEAHQSRIGPRIAHKSPSDSTHSPMPAIKPAYNGSSSDSPTSSEDVFGLLWDKSDNNRSSLSRNDGELGRMRSPNRSVDSLMDDDEYDNENGDDSEEDVNGLPAFNGWTDEEIFKARLRVYAKF